MTAAGDREPQWDVAVVGDGPAGRSLSLACRGHGLRTVTVGQDRPWTATYATWLDNVSAATADVIAAWGPVDAVGLRRRSLGPSYGVFDNRLLRAKLSAGDQYIDLENLAQGVRTAGASAVTMGQVLPKKSVRVATWSKILQQIKSPEAQP